MPMTFTDEMVEDRAKMMGVENTREAVAAGVEAKFGDYVEGWEIRTGRPWDDMTKLEAQDLVHQHPQLMSNPGVLSRLYGGS